jgi:hypothetical protein
VHFKNAAAEREGAYISRTLQQIHTHKHESEREGGRGEEREVRTFQGTAAPSMIFPRLSCRTGQGVRVSDSGRREEGGAMHDGIRRPPKFSVQVRMYKVRLLTIP